MVSFHFIQSLLTLDLQPWRRPSPPTSSAATSKSVAIIGAGSGGLAALKTFLGLPPDVGGNWDVTLYEERYDVGGIWLPDQNPVTPPHLPQTPLYPGLHTNTPVPMMTYPKFPFVPGTPLYPGHEHIQQYHRRFATHYGLLPHIKFRHTVLDSRWMGDQHGGFWNITFTNQLNQTQSKAVDHLVVASGNNHVPRIPTWPGQSLWLDYSRQLKYPRKIVHSIYYRYPADFTNRTLLVIGSSASGQDVAVQTVAFTHKTYLSARHQVVLPAGGEDVVIKPDVSHFTPEGVVFVDGTEVREIDTVILATGYENRKPFLESGNALLVDKTARSNSSSINRGGRLVDNLKYVFPLHRHIFSLDPTYPVTALAFIGLPTKIANCPSDIAQSLLVAHAIANPAILSDRGTLLRELSAQEDELREAGTDPYVFGHYFANGTSNDYQDGLLDFLKSKGAVPDNGVPYVERWRRRILQYSYLKRGWKRLEALGVAEDWVKGVRTEIQWSDLMERINKWQERYEKARNIPFAHDTGLFEY